MTSTVRVHHFISNLSPAPAKRGREEEVSTVPPSTIATEPADADAEMLVENDENKPDVKELNVDSKKQKTEASVRFFFSRLVKLNLKSPLKPPNIRRHRQFSWFRVLTIYEQEKLCPSSLVRFLRADKFSNHPKSALCRSVKKPDAARAMFDKIGIDKQAEETGLGLNFPLPWEERKGLSLGCVLKFYDDMYCFFFEICPGNGYATKDRQFVPLETRWWYNFCCRPTAPTTVTKIGEVLCDNK